MARHVMKLPDVGEGVVDAEVVEWKIKPGDAVEEDQHIVDVMTDKATVEMTAPVAGIVVEVHGAPGDRVAVGSEFVIFETDASAAASAAADKVEPEAEAPAAVEKPAPPAAATPAAAPQQAPAAAPPPAAPAHKPVAAPTVRRRAREAHVDLAEVPGTGRGGRITHQDLDAYIAAGKSAVAAPAAGAAPPPSVPFAAPVSGDDAITEIKLIGMRRAIAEKMAQSKRTIPHFAYVEEVDVTELERLRQHLNANRSEGQAKLTYLPFLMKAVVKAIRDFPQCNSRFDEQAGMISQYGAVHVGVATATPGGLMVPVVRHAELRDVWACAAEMQRVSQAARDGSAKRDELTGSTITITSLGALGGIVSTPVINHPEVAIIGVNKSVERPMIVAGEVVPRLMMNLSCSFDHRIVDGYDAARFVQSIRAMLEYPATIFV